MPKIIVEGNKMRMQLTEDEARKLAADAEKLGLPVQEMLQRKLNEMAAAFIARKKGTPETPGS
jgi:hypothetical protein